ncbi:hypothetical protein [Bradyrhizobium sp. th.b2]|uniref:hypothetical protein n=1 Tax=Bradyrhizobium sp. th-b2 TaxID=172088 RepID=UPI0012EBBFBA|nr:hypothetical protein [Bradyrhizobium sp. th.b2]
MKLFTRRSLAEAFHLPLWGQVATELPPHWLVSRLQTGELEINRLGGLTMQTPFGVMQCAAGDIVLLFADNSIGFEKPDTFEKNFEPVTPELLRAA